MDLHGIPHRRRRGRGRLGRGLVLPAQVRGTEQDHRAARRPLTDEDEALQRRSRLAKQHDIALLLSVLAGGTLGMIVGIVLNGPVT